MKKYRGLDHNLNTCGHHVLVSFNFCSECGQKVESSLHPNKYIGLLMEKLEINCLEDIYSIDPSTLDKEEVLFDLVCSGDLDLLERLIKQGADVNIEDRNNKSLIFCAVDEKKMDVIKMLCNYGVDIDQVGSRGELLMEEAYRKGGISYLNYFLDNGIDINLKNQYGETILYYAIRYKTESEVKELINHGAKININNRDGFSPVDIALENDKIELAKWLADEVNLEVEDMVNEGLGMKLIENGSYMALDFVLSSFIKQIPLNDLFKIDYWGYKYWLNEESISFLIKNGVKMNSKDKYGNTILHDSSLSMETFKMLIKHGLDIHAENQSGVSPLTKAIEGDKVEVVDMLMSNGAKLKSKSGHKPSDIERAFRSKSIAVIKFFMKKGLVLNMNKEELNECLGSAVSRENLCLVRILLDLGADINYTKEYSGWNPLFYAAKEGYHHIIHFLLKHGADIKPVLENIEDIYDYQVESIAFLFEPYGVDLKSYLKKK